MSFTRDWLSSWILDHSKFKTQPSYVRGLMDDVGERLAAYLYGFTSGETFTGFKKLSLITIGTGDGSIPTGTGNQAAINIQGKTIDGKVELITIDADGNEIQFTSKGDFLANNAWFTGNKVGTGGSLNILRINTANQIEVGTHLVAPDTGPTTNLQYAPKGYVDNLHATPLAGAEVQKVTTIYQTPTSTASNIPVDTSKPQITEGLQILQAVITPKSATNRLLFQVVAVGNPYSSGGYRAWVVALFKNGVSDALAANPGNGGAGESALETVSLTYEMEAGTTNELTFSVRVGNVTGTLYINQSGGGITLGGAMTSSITITEIQV